MLQITIPETELYNEETNEFLVSSKAQTLQLEHSLVSLSKWESKWQKPFLTKGVKSKEESVDYIRCMTLTQNVDPNVYNNVTQDNINTVTAYIEAAMTATTFTEEQNTSFSREVITAEIIYYWMVALQIPFECQKWHLNRLLTLVRVCNIKNKPPKKMSQKEAMQQQKILNEMRRKELNSGG